MAAISELHSVYKDMSAQRTKLAGNKLLLRNLNKWILSEMRIAEAARDPYVKDIIKWNSPEGYSSEIRHLTVFNYLKLACPDWTNSSYAALMGNLYKESGYKTTIVGGHGRDPLFLKMKDDYQNIAFGLAQWLGSRIVGLVKHTLTKVGNDDAFNALMLCDLGIQIGNVRREIMSGGYNLTKSAMLDEKMSLADKTWVVLHNYETPEITKPDKDAPEWKKHFISRLDYANEIYKLINKVR